LKQQLPDSGGAGGARKFGANRICMIRRETAEPVVQYLRALTYDGELSSGEVWELANWLNQQPDRVLDEWPAKELTRVLQAAFADQNLTEAELEELANIIVAIEELWLEANPTSYEDAASEEISAGTARIEEGKPEAPSIPIVAEMPDDGRADTFMVDLQHHTCSCPEWTENRQAFPEGDYRRCCSHLTRAFRSLCAHQEELRRDPLFLALVEDYGKRNKGPESDVVWHVVVVNGTRVLYGASPASEWVTVYAPGSDGYKRFGYNRKKQRWAYGDRPKDVAWSMASIFSPTQPQILAGRA
jgi:hypothetical protein